MVIDKQKLSRDAWIARLTFRGKIYPLTTLSSESWYMSQSSNLSRRMQQYLWDNDRKIREKGSGDNKRYT